jgi:type II secretory pathway predicted ATPase ExeA
MAAQAISISRENVRYDLRVYMSKTGWGISELAFRSGYAPRTLLQFMSSARYGDAQGQSAARNLAKFMRENPAELPEFPGRLYETEATRAMDRLIDHAIEGGWGTIYGPAGAQKTFLLEYRAAEAARSEECELVLVGADPALSPRALLGRIARGVAAPYAQQCEALREAILYVLRRRQRPVAVVVDEAQLLYARIDTLETLRRLGDKSRGRIGILVAGNEQVLQLFEPRRNVYFEQWRSRVEQEEAHILGPSEAEARKILAAEVQGIKAAAADEIVAGTKVQDPLSKKSYVNARRLFNTIRMMQRVAARRKAN